MSDFDLFLIIYCVMLPLCLIGVCLTPDAVPGEDQDPEN